VTTPTKTLTTVMKNSGRTATFFVHHIQSIVDGPNGHAIICTSDGEGCEVRETRKALLKRIDVSDADIPN
jgi:hypothetical protein